MGLLIYGDVVGIAKEILSVQHEEDKEHHKTRRVVSTKLFFCYFHSVLNL